MKYLGRYKGVPMFENPHLPANTAIIVEGNIMINRTRWQKVRDWLNGILSKLRFKDEPPENND